MSLNKIIIADEESGIETCFSISRLNNAVFLPKNNRSKKLFCTMSFDDGNQERTEHHSVAELDQFLSSKAAELVYYYQGLTEEPLPQLSYCDITEKVLLSSKEMKKGTLSSDTNGMLAWFGIRKLSVSFENKFSNIKFTNTDKFISADLRVKSANGEPVDEMILFVNSNIAINDDKPVFLFDIDTDKLGELFNNPKFAHLENLRLSWIIRIIAKSEKGGNRIEIFYPMDISLINTNPSIFRNISSDAASIDFGTTSTCVAVNKSEGKELLTISPADDNISNYENPTNLMVFDWNNIFKEWVEKCDTVIPSFYKGGKSENTLWQKNESESPVHFDFGYTVKDELGAELPNRRTIHSIMTLLKMIPYRIIHDKRQLRFNPYNDTEKFVHIVTSPAEQDENHFDPVAFYGYLIGRMINDRTKQKKIHTHFQVTSPVKFNDEVKESIRNSLLYGLKRTVPKPLQESVKVEMINCEPVAFIGAICGTEYLTINGDETVKFAVYDFGGGTLDFSFGEVSCNDDGETKIDVRMTGGDEKIGGESIIERLTFMLYKHNIDRMKQNSIPIEKPINAQLPDNCDEQLFLPSPYGIANANIINYRISRKIFEGGNVDQRCDLNLYDLNGKEVKVEINCPKDEMDSEVEKIVKESVKIFSKELKAAFDDLSADELKKIRIYLAGNSSKNKHVLPAMKAEFPNASIERPDETASIKEDNKVTSSIIASTPTGSNAPIRRKNKSTDVKQDIAGGEAASEEPAVSFEPAIAENSGANYIEVLNVNRRYAITPKTAVALGQLELHNMTVIDRTKNSFMMNVGFVIPAKREIKTILKKGEITNEWIKFRKIPDSGKVPIYYSESGMDFLKHSKIPYPRYEVEGEREKVIYVRAKDKFIIEYCFADNDKEVPSENVDTQIIDFSQLLVKEG